MRIQKKLFTVLSLFSVFILMAMLLVFQWSIDRGMVDYVNKKEVSALKSVAIALEDEYKNKNSWEPLFRNHQKFRSVIAKGLEGSSFKPPNPPEHSGRLDQSAQSNLNEMTRRPRPVHQVSYALLDQNMNFIVGHFPDDVEYSYLPLSAAGTAIGFLAVSKRHDLTEGYEFDLVNAQKYWLWSAAFLLFILVLLSSYFLARHLVSPILQLRQAIKKTKHGIYIQAPETHRNDEFDQLYVDYNQLVLELQAHEASHKRWLADISHELRTPIAIIRGELEAILDEVRPLSLGIINSVYEEVLMLQGLTEDLHLLNSAEIGGMEFNLRRIGLHTFIEKEMQHISGYLADAGIEINIVYEDHNEIFIMADPKRLKQLLNNLFSNVVKYADASKVVLELLVEEGVNGRHAQIKFEDDGQGVGTEYLSKIFDPLFRTDISRSRNKGGTGLGLAICAHIVDGHQGTFAAYKSRFGGLGISISFPLLANDGVMN